MPQQRDAASGENALGRDLVHQHRGRQGTHAGIGDVGALEEALKLPVLAAEPVKGQQRDIELDWRPAREQPSLARQQPARAAGSDVERDLAQFGAQRRVRQVVAAVFEARAGEPIALRRHIDHKRREARLVERLQSLKSGDDADVVLGRAPAEKHGNSGFHRGVLSYRRMSSASPKREDCRAGKTQFAVYRVGGAAPSGAARLIWAHGWGHTHRALLPLAQAMRPATDSWLVDLPGFGDSPLPPGPWGTEDYADAMAEWLATLPPGRKIWIGHSFGCRVGLQLAARHPQAVEALFLIAAAGLPS